MGRGPRLPDQLLVNDLGARYEPEANFEFPAKNQIGFFSAYAIYYLCTTPGTFKERIRLGITPVIQPRADAIAATEKRLAKQAAKASAGEAGQQVDLDVELRLVDSPENNGDIVIGSSNHL